MGRIPIIIRAVIGATVMTGGMAALTPAAQAVTISVGCSENALVTAVNQANSTPATDTLVLTSGCTYNMKSSHGSPANGQEALPVITTPIEMTGPATIKRDSQQVFRIAEISPTGKLTLTRVALTNGNADGDGGAILNRGTVTLTDSSLSGNTANNGGALANPNTPSGAAPTATLNNSPVSNNIARANGGGIYNGIRGTLTTSGVSGNPLLITGNEAPTGGGIVAFSSTKTTLNRTTVTTNRAHLTTGGGVYRQGGTMTTTSSTITGNVPNNCVGSSPSVPNCTN